MLLLIPIEQGIFSFNLKGIFSPLLLHKLSISLAQMAREAQGAILP